MKEREKYNIYRWIKKRENELDVEGRFKGTIFITTQNMCGKRKYNKYQK